MKRVRTKRTTKTEMQKMIQNTRARLRYLEKHILSPGDPRLRDPRQRGYARLEARRAVDRILDVLVEL